LLEKIDGEIIGEEIPHRVAGNLPVMTATCHYFWCGVWLMAGAVLFAAPGAGVPVPPIESNGWSRLPKSAEVDRFLGELAAGSEKARLVRIGRSAGDRPLHALLISRRRDFRATGMFSPERLVVLLIGGQHGTEPSGAEALQRAAVELIAGRLSHHLERMDFVLAVNANPDGRDLGRRVNAAGVNLSTDFAVVSQPETRALLGCMRRYAPHILLDLHESAVLKKRSLGAQGYLTDHEAQFEVSNNPDIHPALLGLGRETLLPAMIAAVNARGLRCRHYVGEITDINQPVTHGGLSIRNIRNYAGMRGTLGVLVENRLDPPGDWPTERNLKVRVAKQGLCLLAFLEACEAARPQILAATEAARRGGREDIREQGLALAPAYAGDPARPHITLPMRRRDSGEPVERSFVYRPRIVVGPRQVPPCTYFIRGHHERFARVLDRHGIPFSRLEHSTKVESIRQRVSKLTQITKPGGMTSSVIEVTESEAEVTLSAGDLRIDPLGLGARLAPLLLDPRSSSSVFGAAEFRALLSEGEDLFIVRSR